MPILSPERQSSSRFSLYPRQRLKKLGGDAMSIAANKEAILARQRILNNDALAPIYTFLRNERGAEFTEQQIYAEYVTDMSERSTETPFYSSFNYEWDGQDYIANTGENLTNVLANGLMAAKADALADPDLNIGVDLALAYKAQPEIIRSWELSIENRPLLLASLCPPPKELPENIAKKLSRKQDRLMASMWVLQKSANGTIDVRAFSLDNLRIEDLLSLRNAGLVDGGISKTTIGQVQQPLLINYTQNADNAVELVRSYHDKALHQSVGSEHYFGISTSAQATANETIATKPQAYQLYKSIISEVALSLLQAQPTTDLKAHVAYLANPFTLQQVPNALRIGNNFTEAEARELMEYLRSRALPHYLFGRSTIDIGTTSNTISSSGIAEAGADATTKGLDYDGACQTSELTGTQAAQTLTEAYQQKGNIELLQCVTCPYCKKETTAKIVHSANTIECMRQDCRAKLNTKTGKRIDERFASQANSQTLADLLIKFFFGDETEDNVKKSKLQKNPKVAKGPKVSKGKVSQAG